MTPTLRNEEKTRRKFPQSYFYRNDLWSHNSAKCCLNPRSISIFDVVVVLVFRKILVFEDHSKCQKRYRLNKKKISVASRLARTYILKALGIPLHWYSKGCSNFEFKFGEVHWCSPLGQYSHLSSSVKYLVYPSCSPKSKQTWNCSSVKRMITTNSSTIHLHILNHLYNEEVGCKITTGRRNNNILFCEVCLFIRMSWRIVPYLQWHDIAKFKFLQCSCHTQGKTIRYVTMW